MGTKTYTLEEMKANRRLWVEALRGGAYEQGDEFLRSLDDKFCCLGVLADIAGCDWRKDNISKDADGCSRSAPKRAMDFVGLAESEGKYDFGSDFVSLAIHNDGGKTFAELADIIESEPEGLFLSRSDS